MGRGRTKQIGRFVVFFLLLFLSLEGLTQPGGEIGVMGGTGYYLGEYNLKHFGQRQLYTGVLYRYNFNDRFALRLNAGLSEINVKHKWLSGIKGDGYPEPLVREIYDVDAVVEFNFRSFLVRKTEKSSWWSPYMFCGVGYLGTEEIHTVSIPMGVGVKFNLFRQFSWGVEWGTRKLFTDKIDGVGDPWGTKETNFVYNKDWFFVAGITLTYRFPVEPECFF